MPVANGSYFGNSMSPIFRPYTGRVYVRLALVIAVIGMGVVVNAAAAIIEQVGHQD